MSYNHLGGNSRIQIHVYWCQCQITYIIISLFDLSLKEINLIFLFNYVISLKEEQWYPAIIQEKTIVKGLEN